MRWVAISILAFAHCASFACSKTMQIMGGRPWFKTYVSGFTYQETSVGFFYLNDSVFPNDEMCKFKNIEYLFVSYCNEGASINSKVSIDAEKLKKLYGLKYLEIAGAPFDSTWSLLLSLPGLTGLSLNLCGIQSFATSKYCAENLEYLDIDYNLLKSFVGLETIAPKLEYLSSIGNPIAILPTLSLSNLKYFYSDAWPLTEDFSYFDKCTVSNTGSPYWPAYDFERVRIDSCFMPIFDLLRRKQFRKMEFVTDEYDDLSLWYKQFSNLRWTEKICFRKLNVYNSEVRPNPYHYKYFTRSNRVKFISLF